MRAPVQPRTMHPHRGNALLPPRHALLMPSPAGACPQPKLRDETVGLAAWHLSAKPKSIALRTLLMSTPAGVWYLATVTATAEPSLSSTRVCRWKRYKMSYWQEAGARVCGAPGSLDRRGMQHGRWVRQMPAVALVEPFAAPATRSTHIPLLSQACANIVCQLEASTPALGQHPAPGQHPRLPGSSPFQTCPRPPPPPAGCPSERLQAPAQ